MVDPADPQDEENLSGGWYELAVEFDRPDEVRVDAAVRELSRLAGVEPVTGGHGLRLPDGARVVCTYAVIEDGPAEEGEAGGSVWSFLACPLVPWCGSTHGWVPTRSVKTAAPRGARRSMRG